MTARSAHTAWACVVLGLTLGACSRGPEPLTSTTPYADLIGAEYRVLVDDLYAYGTYGNLPDRTVTVVRLKPGSELGDPDLAFRRQIPNGTVLRIESAWRQQRTFGSDVYYLVTAAGTDLPRDVPVRIELLDGNQGDGAGLNARIYRRLPGTTPR